MGKKVYAVRNGRKTGVFDTWAECQRQTTGFSGAEFKSFTTREGAEAYLAGEDGEDVFTVSQGTEALVGDGTMTAYVDAQMHNVAGEIKGAEAAMRFAVANQIKRLVIYHDYEGIAKWCNGAWKANKEGTKAYQAYYKSIRSMLDIEFVKVKGHSNDHYNDMADALAKQALGLGDTDYTTEDFQGLYA